MAPGTESPRLNAVPRLRRWRWLIAALLAVFLVVVIRISFLQGLYTAVRIVGPSMAPTLQGRHGLLTCDSCRYPLRVDSEQSEPSLVTCFNCGHGHINAATVSVAGERVLIDRWPLTVRTPRRMDIVAFNAPDQEQAMLAVKRVLGLPGELVAIRNGEIYLNNQLWQKSLADHRALSVLVHDNDYLPARDQPPHSPWYSDRAAGWHFDPALGTHTIDQQGPVRRGMRVPYTWLPFRPAASIKDNDAYNPDVSRRLNNVTDVRITANVSTQGTGRFATNLSNGRSQFVIEYSIEDGIVTLKDGFDHDLAVVKRTQLGDQSFNWEVALIDQQVFVAIDGRELMRHTFADSDYLIGALDYPGKLGSFDATVSISDLRVYRDVYWLNSDNTGQPWIAASPVGPDEYFLLGDNVPVSTDSRHFGPVKREAIRGIVRKINDNN